MTFREAIKYARENIIAYTSEMADFKATAIEALEELATPKEITSKKALKATEVLSTYCTDAPNNNCEEMKCSLYQWCVKGE